MSRAHSSLVVCSAESQIRVQLAARGLAFNNIDREPFRGQLAPFYAKWK
jgi:hypothetical protein